MLYLWTYVYGTVGKTVGKMIHNLNVKSHRSQFLIHKAFLNERTNTMNDITKKIRGYSGRQPRFKKVSLKRQNYQKFVIEIKKDNYSKNYYS